MKAIPRALAGTAVVLAAVLTTAPLTAGIADFVLNPGQPPGKRPVSEAPPSDSSTDAQIPAAVASSTLRVNHARRSSARTTDRSPEATPLQGRTLIPAESGNADATRGAVARQAVATQKAVAAQAATAPAATQEAVDAQVREVVSAEARIAELAADLQAGVEAGEMTKEDAARVLEDLSGYIRGERTWPERRIG
ncbi:hypothetical protein [Brevibacterium sp.]|uniref:hypothetical protein n=1 Tax=Brevibacterium sp. TaxID=1701 RepID=UPI0028127153|nr:hypothetical protein [Brevibacterium sp.]